LFIERRAADDRYLLTTGRTAANPQQRSVVGIGQIIGQTDRRTPYRYTDPALHTMEAQAVPQLNVRLQTVPKQVLQTMMIMMMIKCSGG